MERGAAAGPVAYHEYGVQTSRAFRALKVWMSLKAHGARLFGRLVEQNVRQARHLARLVESHPRLELLAPAPLNVVCFRFRVERLSEIELNALNEEILLRVQEGGLAVPSGTTLGGTFAIRVAVTNHRSRLPDFDLLVKAVAEAGGSAVNSADGRLIVSGLVAAQVGDIAFEHGVRLHELTATRASLEAAFMELTADSVEYQAGVPAQQAATQQAAPPQAAQPQVTGRQV
jgi:hypothetical protein